MRFLILVTLVMLAAASARAQDQNSLIPLLNSLVFTELAHKKCGGLPQNVLGSVTGRQKDVIRQGNIPTGAVNDLRAKAQAAVQAEPCESPQIRNMLQIAVADFGLKQSVRALVIHSRCNLLSQGSVDQLNREMSAYAGVLRLTKNDLQVVQKEIAGTVQIDCNGPEAQRLKASLQQEMQRQAAGQQGGGQNQQAGAGSGNMSAAQQQELAFSLLLAAQEANRKCRAFAPSEMAQVNQRLLDLAKRNQISAQQIATARNGVSQRVARQQCNGKELQDVVRWVRCGFPSDLVCR